jgi:hypothetical protein
MDDTRLGSEPCELNACRRGREIKDAFGCCEGSKRVVGDAYPAGPDACDFPGILPERRRIRALDRAGKNGPGRGMNGADELTAHSPRSTGNDQPHVSHCHSLPSRKAPN